MLRIFRLFRILRTFRIFKTLKGLYAIGQTLLSALVMCDDISWYVLPTIIWWFVKIYGLGRLFWALFAGIVIYMIWYVYFICLYHVSHVSYMTYMSHVSYMTYMSHVSYMICLYHMSIWHRCTSGVCVCVCVCVCKCVTQSHVMSYVYIISYVYMACLPCILSWSGALYCTAIIVSTMSKSTLYHCRTTLTRFSILNTKFCLMYFPIGQPRMHSRLFTTIW
jgi:hypothetical protein